MRLRLESFTLLHLLVIPVLSQDLNDTTIGSMAPLSLFTRWRPKSHFLAPAGWMNDPNGPMYNPTTDTYHLFYQWHPHHFNWGNISWGHAISKDLVTWSDVGGWEGSNALALGPTGNGTYNGLGIFSGSAQAVNLSGAQDGTLLAMYTSVSRLPIDIEAETQSFAISTDSGQTWQDYEGNPVITRPPDGWNVNGWRDPFFKSWPEMDDLLDQDEPHFYVVFGAGIDDVGSRMPLYSAPSSNLSNWTFLGALWEPGPGESLGDVDETGSWGVGFECPGFFSLPDSNGTPHYFVNMGTESVPVPFRSLWNEGIVLKRANGSVSFEPISGGAADWGNLYALISFNDTKNDRRVLWGWLAEDMGDYVPQQGWQGLFNIPREIFVHETSGVQNASAGVGNVVFTQQSDGTLLATTLGVRPLEDVVAGLRNGSTAVSHETSVESTNRTLSNTGSDSLELSATFSNISGSVGFTVVASPGGEEITQIFFDPSNSSVKVDRSRSTLLSNPSKSIVSGHFQPFTFQNGSSEDINMRVFVDASVLEVYVNDRFALTTRIYPSREDSKGYGFYIASGAMATVSNAMAYVGLATVFPERPANSSTNLIVDTSAQTNNGVWWVGT